MHFDFISGLFVLMLSTFLGLDVIRRVSRLLHTPLMSLTNAISAIAIVGAIIITGEQHTTLSTILGAVGFLRIAVWSAFSDIYGAHWLGVAVTVAISLVGVVLWGTLSGSLLPFALKRLGFDPATSSAPFVATMVDVTGLVIYFSVALVILRGTLL